MADLSARLDEALTGAAADWFAEARRRLAADPARALPVLLPGLARRVGRAWLGGGACTMPIPGGGSARVDLDHWRLCDAAGLLLLREAGPDDAALADLFRHGDKEERRIVLRSLHLLPITDATVHLLGEAQRTNDVDHFEAAACDGDLAVRALAHARFDQVDLDRLALKLAFLDLPLDRMPGLLGHANAELSRMLEDLAREREVAGRKVWADTVRVQARAPLADTETRLRAALEHADVEARRAAARALADPAAGALREALRDAAAARLEQEADPLARAALQRALDT